MEKPTFYWLNKNNNAARKFLQNGYLLEGVSAEERIEQIASTAQELLEEMYWEKPDNKGTILPSEIASFKHYFMKNMEQGVYSLASPVWANFGLERGLPISCFGSYIQDSMESILETHKEVGVMTKVGGGTSGYFGDIRPRGSKITNNGRSDGSYSFATLFDRLINVVSQGTTRRGHFAGYIPIDHGDIDEWLNIQHPGDDIQTMMYGVLVPDYWMQEMIDGDQEKRERWAKVLKNRIELGVPYIMFIDNCNKNRPDVYKDKGYTIKGSNLCSEILLPSNKDESFVCCLSSLNAARSECWDQYKSVQTMTLFLDAVMEDFVRKSKSINGLERAHRFARRHRSIGMGVLGWHTHLQQTMTPFDSMGARYKNDEIFGKIKERSYAQSERMASYFGEPEVMEGYGRRNATTMAVAPTKSSSYILGQVSQGIQPIRANYFIRDTAKKMSTYKNPQLKALLQEKDADTPEVWKKIGDNRGSVQELDILTDHEKEVFKTFGEISQLGIVRLAAQRQVRHIDQGQSLNVAIDPSVVEFKDINKLHIEAWKLGVTCLYYQMSVNAAQGYANDILNCKTCEG